MDRYLLFNPFWGEPHGNAEVSDYESFSAVLDALDEMVGCADRRWLADTTVRLDDSFFLTGMDAGAARRVWRMSLREGLASVTVASAGEGLAVGPVALSLANGSVAINCSTVFAKGVVANLTQDEVARSSGLWVVTPQAAAPPEARCNGESAEWPSFAL